MPGLALFLAAVFGLLAVGLRALYQLRQTGSSGIKGISGEFGSVEWLGGALFVAGWALVVAAAVLARADAVEAIDALDEATVHAAGIGLFWGGLVTTLAAQFAMGESWRIGVDPAERTPLVTEGPFAIVRNPIYSGMLPAALGLVLLVPSVVAIAGWLMLLAALEIQTRVVEEPHLLRTHGREYADYAARVGRFVPLVGRLRRRPR